MDADIAKLAPVTRAFHAAERELGLVLGPRPDADGNLQFGVIGPMD